MFKLLIGISAFSFIFFATELSAQNVLENAKRDAVVKKHATAIGQDFTSKNLKIGNVVFFRIFKEDTGYDSGCLEIWVQSNDKKSYILFKTYAICTFSGGFGTKTKEGDGKTPEGFYNILPDKINQYSSYHRAFNIGYPNRYEKLKGYTGNYIMIHGACCSIGCIAMTDSYIEEIWTIAVKAFAQGQSSIPAHIFPFRLTDENIKKHSDYPDKTFLTELKTGFEYFEKNNRPPTVSAIKNSTTVKYTFK